MSDEKLKSSLKKIKEKLYNNPISKNNMLIKVTYNSSKQITTVEFEGNTSVYRQSEIRILYNEQVIEIHADKVFVALLPMSHTFIFFEYED